MSKVMNRLNNPCLAIMALAAITMLGAYAWKHKPHEKPETPKANINDFIIRGERDLERHHRMEKKATIVELFADDGMPVNQSIKATEQRRMLKVRGKL